ncbi:MAG: methylmalonyl Co-A mutase-associated GTPase MeaB, partial [Candidatus Thorarchaeota archaeon]
MSAEKLVKGVLQGNRRDLARLISLVEDEAPSADEALSSLYKHTGNALIVGVTGPPGSGKSTLVT